MHPRGQDEKYLETKIAEIPPNIIPRIMFWGEQRVPSDLESKYTYKRQSFGTKQNKKFMFIKVPNIKRLRRTILTRKLLSINHAFSQTIDHLLDSNYRGLDIDEVERKVLEDTQKLRKNTSKKNLFISRQNRLMKIEQSKSIIKTDYKLVPNEKALLLACNDGAERLKVVSTTGIGYVEEPDSSKPLETAQLELEKKQCKNRLYAKAMSRDLYSMDISHVLISTQMSASGNDDCYFRLNTSPGMLVTILEIMRAGLCFHNWPLVSKCLEGMSQNCQAPHKKWIAWTAGMLSLVNTYKNDISRLIQFHRVFQKVNGGYPVKFGIDTATWLIQKGYFITGTAILEAEQDNIEKMWVLHGRKFDTIRRRRIDFVAEIINAISQYAIYKVKDPEEPESIQFAESVLIMFEALVEKSEVFQYDATVFLEPTVELMLKIRGKLSVQEIYKKLCERNPGNAILAEMYLKFLKEHFPDYEGEIEDMEREVGYFNFEYRGNQYDAKRIALGKYLKKQREKGKSESFQKLKLPAFSW